MFGFQAVSVQRGGQKQAQKPPSAASQYGSAWAVGGEQRPQIEATAPHPQPLAPNLGIGNPRKEQSCQPLQSAARSRCSRPCRPTRECRVCIACVARGERGCTASPGGGGASAAAGAGGSLLACEQASVAASLATILLCCREPTTLACCSTLPANAALRNSNGSRWVGPALPCRCHHATLSAHAHALMPRSVPADADQPLPTDPIHPP